MYFLTEIQENNLAIMNRIQEDENNLDELQKSIKNEEKFKLEEIETVAKGLKDIDQAMKATKNREKQMLSNMNVKMKKTADGEKYVIEEQKGLNKIVIDKIKQIHSKSKLLKLKI